MVLKKRKYNSLQCSKSCAGGTQRRTAKCIDDSNNLIDDAYCKNNELITQQICNTQSCPVWKLAETSSVSKKLFFEYSVIQNGNHLC